MTVVADITSPAVQSFTSTLWTEVGSVMYHMRLDGDEFPYTINSKWKLHISAEYGGDNINEHVGIRVLINSVEKSFDYHNPTLAGQYKKFTDFGILEVDTEDDYTVSLEVRAVDVTQTVNVRRIRLLIEKY